MVDISQTQANAAEQRNASLSSDFTCANLLNQPLISNNMFDLHANLHNRNQSCHAQTHLNLPQKFDDGHEDFRELALLFNPLSNYSPASLQHTTQPQINNSQYPYSSQYQYQHQQHHQQFQNFNYQCPPAAPNSVLFQRLYPSCQPNTGFPSPVSSSFDSVCSSISQTFHNSRSHPATSQTSRNTQIDNDIDAEQIAAIEAEVGVVEPDDDDDDNRFKFTFLDHELDLDIDARSSISASASVSAAASSVSVSSVVGSDTSKIAGGRGCGSSDNSLGTLNVGVTVSCGSKRSLSSSEGPCERDREKEKDSARSKWCAKDSQLLWEGIMTFGNEWRAIRKLFPGRSYDQVKDKGRRMLRQKQWKTGRTKYAVDDAATRAKQIALNVLTPISETEPETQRDSDAHKAKSKAVSSSSISAAATDKKSRRKNSSLAIACSGIASASLAAKSTDKKSLVNSIAASSVSRAKRIKRSKVKTEVEN